MGQTIKMQYFTGIRCRTNCKINSTYQAKDLISGKKKCDPMFPSAAMPVKNFNEAPDSYLNVLQPYF